MNDEKSNRLFPDLNGSFAALKRAAERAKRLAEQTGTELVTASRRQTRKIVPGQPGSKTGS